MDCISPLRKDKVRFYKLCNYLIFNFKIIAINALRIVNILQVCRGVILKRE